ncbi:MAG: FAD-dependent oxidoreductase [Promethearchaeota archaeon]
MSKRVLVIGGGISGIKAAVDLGQLGIETDLIERTDNLGGTFAELGKTFPHDVDAQTFINKQIQTLKSLQNVKIHTNTQLTALRKNGNGFEVTLDPSGETFHVGSVIVATGFSPFDATRIPNYGYRKYTNVINALDLADMLKKGELNRPSDKKPPRSITFILCVGSRDKKTNEYCSSFCCTYSVHLAKMIKELDQAIDVMIMYMDIRTFSSYETLFLEARQEGIKFLRGKPSYISENSETQELTIQVENTITRELLFQKTDLIVLSIGAEPAAASEELGKVLNLTRHEKTGFFITKEEDDTTAVGQDRIFIVGNASGPKDAQYSLAQASAAALKAAIIINGLE